MRINNGQKNKHFFMIPNSLVDSGLLAQMSKAELKVYLTIARFANFKSGNAFPSFKLISKKSGIGKNTVGSAEKSLVNYGLIKMRRAPGAFKFRNVFMIFRNPEIKNLISPTHKDKRKGICRKKNGRWGVSPTHKESAVSPTHKESAVSPTGPDKKEIKRDINILSIKEIQPSPTISKETIKILIKEMGEERLKKYMSEHGYDLNLLRE